VPGAQRYPGAPQQAAFFEQAAERLRRIPGVRRLALSDSVPLNGPSNTMIFSNIEIARGAPRFESFLLSLFAAIGVLLAHDAKNAGLTGTDDPEYSPFMPEI
jgi:hypothetical protein